MSKCMPERIKNAVKAMWEHDRERKRKCLLYFTKDGYDRFTDAVDVSSCAAIAMDLLGVPKDNSLEFSDEVQETGIFPKGYMCRDGLFDIWFGLRSDETCQDFIDACKQVIRDQRL